jgi:glycine/D-amino acid oxidase-like deaminating enzyme
MSQLPRSVHAVVIGAGIHGLSTGWHLGLELARRRRGSGQDVIVLDKTGVGAGASGIACGCVRNLYMTEPLHAILRHSVDVWTYDPVAFGFQQVGYVGVDEEQNLPAYERVWRSQNAAGYPSELYAGEDARRFVRSLWPDFNTARVGLALHERVSGYAGTRQAVAGLARKCAEQGVRVLPGIEVTGYDVEGARVRAVLTSQGRIACDVVVWGLGAWTPRHWAMLGQPPTVTCRYPDGTVETKDMWTYWRLLEGEVYADEPYVTAAGVNPPVLHVETSEPVVDPATGRPIKDFTYVYFKNGNERMDRPGLQGGTTPVKLGPVAATDPYGHANDEYQADPWFADYFCAAMGQTMSRFKGCRPNFRERRNGGIGAFTPDNVPVFDWVAPNVFMIADSNHGFKMTGAGKLVARFLMGDDVPELKPFALARYATGRTFGASGSHSPWV